MLKKISILSAILPLYSCGGMPGMQNIDMSAMQKPMGEKVDAVTSTLIPITPALIADTRVSKYFYHVAPADVLNIAVWQHPEFSLSDMSAVGIGNMEDMTTAMAPSTQRAAGGQTGYLVNPNGEIYFPLVGYVPVANRTIDEVRSRIILGLQKYVHNPQVSVRVSDFRGRKVYVFGEVMKPGFLPLTDQPLSITDALTLSGSIDSNAADPSHIYIIRGHYTHPIVYWLNAKTPMALLLAEEFNLQPGDVLYVSSAAATRWNRVLNELLPTLQAAWFTLSMTNTIHN